MTHDYAITFACFNSIDFTKACIDSLVKVGTSLSKLVVVDNGSTDGTRDYLAALSLGGRIFNECNLACGVAWNQGILHQQAEWTVVMNNDLLVSPQWIENLIGIAVANNLKVISPGRIDGPLDYDFDRFAAQSSYTMRDALRRQMQHAVCVCIHRSVFMEIGFFRPSPKLLGFEDTIFFNDLKKSGLSSAITGGVWLHHFGSVTQKAMKKDLGKLESEVLVKVDDRKLLQQGWFERKLGKFLLKKQVAQYRESEFRKYKMTMLGERINHDFIWR